MPKQVWPAPERNKEAILEVLQRVFPGTGRVLEIASGSGQHAAHFARNLPGLLFQPSDVDPENLESIRAWVREAKLPNLFEPIALDVQSADWGAVYDAIFNANMVHIAPWECAKALLRGVGRHLESGGAFAIYGPFKLGGVHTSESNAAFDEDLKRRDPRWGVRDAEAVITLAEEAGLTFSERVPMPANNQTLVFVR